MEYTLKLADKSITSIQNELKHLSQEYNTLMIPDLCEETDFDKIIAALNAIPANIYCLDLSNMDLHQRPLTQLQALLKAPPCTIEKLDLSSNGLCNVILPAENISRSLKYLDLSYNGYQINKDLHALARNLPDELTTLEFHGNNLEFADYSSIRDLFQQFKTPMKTLISSVFRIDPHLFNEEIYQCTFGRTNLFNTHHQINLLSKTYGLFAIEQSCAALTLAVKFAAENREAQGKKFT